MDNHFIINTGNLMQNEYVDDFKNQLDYINNFNGKELKAIYLDKLRERNFPKNGGTAGIGLIDIARRLISPFNYSFKKIDNKKTFVFVKCYSMISKFELKPTRDTPEVIFDPTNNIFSIKGNSLPEDAASFFNPIFQMG